METANENISEKTLLTALVNYKCVGYFGKCLTPFPISQRGRVVETLISRGYLTENLKITDAAKDVIISNLHLCQY